MNGDATNQVLMSSCLLLALTAVAPAAAQVTRTTGAINGTVTDNTKGVLPGVTVTVQSPQMMGTREAITDEQGRYQFAAVPPGDYRITFALSAFTTVIHESIRVSLGFTATVNAELQVATQRETVTVSGDSPVVDLASTKIANNFDAPTLANRPTSRDFFALMSETPATSITRIDVGGSAALSEIGFTVYGLSGGGDQPSLEGIMMGTLWYTDFGTLQDVQLTTAAHTAEMAVPGVMVNAIVKSGGNAYQGTLYSSYERGNWGSRNIDQNQLDRGVAGGPNLDARDTNRVDFYTDTDGDLGGYIKKDKLWWFGDARYNASGVRFVNFPVKPQFTSAKNYGGKVTYNLNEKNKLIGFYLHAFKYQPERFVDKNQLITSLDEPRVQDTPFDTFKVEYNSVLSNSAFFEIRVGNHKYDFYQISRAPQKLLYVDLATAQRFGGTDSNVQRVDRPQMNGSLSYFKSGWGGSHNVKAGGEIADWWEWNREYGKFSRGQIDPFNDAAIAGIAAAPPYLDVEQRLINGVPAQVVLNETPTTSENFEWTYSAYASDLWQLNHRLSLNLGIRFDRYRVGSPAQVHLADPFNPTEQHFAAIPDAFHFNALGPRLGIAWDIWGNGKTLVKANWGAYTWRPSRTVPGTNPNPRIWSKTYAWTPANCTYPACVYQPGQEGQLIAESGGITNALVDPNWKIDITKETTTWLERELFPNFGFRTGLVWRRHLNPQVTLNPNRPIGAYNVPVTVQDPGPDGRLGTADDGGTFPAYNLSAAALALPIINMTTNNKNGSGEDYYTWEIAGVKRMTDNWALNASFVHTWSLVAPNGITPNDFIGTSADGRLHYRNWQGNLAGTIQLPRDVKVSPVVRYQSGNPFGRTIQTRLNYGTQAILVEPVSTRRTDNITLVDVRLEKGFRMNGRRAALFLDVFNILNANPDQNVVQSSGATFLRPINIVSPRVAAIGAKFEF